MPAVRLLPGKIRTLDGGTFRSYPARLLMRRRTLIKLALPLLAIFFCFILIEIAARIVINRGTMHLGVEMWKYAKYVKSRSSNPEIGHRHQPNADRVLMGRRVQTNEHGLRDFPVVMPKPANTTRIMVLGDSITFGWGVEFSSLYCKLVEKALNANPPVPGRKYEVINTGVGNSNTAMETAWFKQDGYKLDPDYVWLGWFINDAEPTPVPTKNWIAYHSFTYVLLDSAVDGMMRKSGKKEDYRGFYSGLYGADRPGWIKCQNAFEDLAKFCAEKKLPLRVLLIPELHSLGPNYEFTDVHDKIRALSAKVGAPTLELLDAFPQTGNPLQYWVCPTDAHPNEKGNELMADYINKKLREENWLK